MSVTAVVACVEQGRHLAATLESLRRQTHADLEVIVLEDGATDAPVPYIDAAVSRLWHARRVRASLARPGAGWNAALRVARGTHLVCLDEGDTLEPPYLERACARLAGDDTLAFVTAWVRSVSAGRVTVEPAMGCDLAAVVASPWAVPLPSLFRRTTWEAAGGFDETLEALEEYDFWLRVLTGGGRGAVLEAPLITRPARRRARYRRALEAEGREPALRALVERHREAFEADITGALLACKRLFVTALREHRRLVHRRDDVVAEMEALEAERGRLLDAVRAAGAAAVDWGDLRRTSPLSARWGYERGTPVDRRYIHAFLAAHAEDIHGRVLEVQEPDLSRRFGGERVTDVDVVDIDAANPRATIVADLRAAENIASDRYDCIVLTQTLHVIDDMAAVLTQCRRLLKPGGVLLATLPAASRVGLEYGPDGDFWRVTEAGARRLFADAFGAARVQTRAYGNVLASAAFLYGLAAEEVTDDELAVTDPYFPLLIGVRAVKAGGERPVARARGTDEAATILLYHRVADSAVDVHGLCVSPDLFRAQMEHLRREYRPLSLAALADGLAARDLPPRSVAVTFDDGYLDNLTAASPILLDLDIPATFFVTTAPLGEPREFWWDTLERVFFGSGYRPPTLDLRMCGIPPVATRTADERRAAHGHLYPILAAAGHAERDDLVGGLLEWSGLAPVAPTSARPMTGDEVVRLAARPGHDVGAHGVHHLPLPALAADARRAEAECGRLHLERLLGRAVTTFAYPFGAVDDATVTSVGAAGYACAVTCESAAARAGCDPLRLPRVEVRASDAREFEHLLVAYSGRSAT